MPEVSQEIRHRARVRLRSLLLQNLVAFGLRGFCILDFHPQSSQARQDWDQGKGAQNAPWWVVSHRDWRPGLACLRTDFQAWKGQPQTTLAPSHDLSVASPSPPHSGSPHRPLGTPFVPSLCCSQMDLPKTQLSQSFLCKKLSFGCPSKSKPLVGCIRPFSVPHPPRSEPTMFPK